MPPLFDRQGQHQPGERSQSRPPAKAVGDVYQRFSAAFHLVWGRVVPDIPDFCRELIAALAEE
ncbi:MAG TPA: hypothetical protein VE525_07555 [Rubrobacter sp.]|nr:hypothetical protein [Rubrobacter sp.]